MFAAVIESAHAGLTLLTGTGLQAIDQAVAREIRRTDLLAADEGPAFLAIHPYPDLSDPDAVSRWLAALGRSLSDPCVTYFTDGDIIHVA